MPAKQDKNYVSVWFWMFALFVMALPCIGFVMVIVWAFVGENESRKNYFRAVIIWYLLFLALFGLLVAFNLAPGILRQLQEWLGRLR